jgi:hypothetical protein
LGTKINTHGRSSRLQARGDQAKLSLEKRVTVLLVDSDRPAQHDKQIGSRRHDRIQIIQTDVDIAHVISGFDECGFE